jgi:hypothetical protein
MFSHQLLAVGDKVRQDLLAAGVGTLKKFSLMPPGLEIKDLPSKRITQGHRILKPKQVRREILIPSLPFHIRAKLRETLRLNAAYTASKTPPLELQRLPPSARNIYRL